MLSGSSLQPQLPQKHAGDADTGGVGAAGAVKTGCCAGCSGWKNSG